METEVPHDRPVRPLPALEDATRFFWTGGADGALRFLRCHSCRTWVHPPRPACPACRGVDLEPEAVSGRARVLGWTVNHQPWLPGFPPPYTIAVVGIDEDPTVRLTTNLIDVEADELRVGLPVEVVFEHHDDVWLPLFRPVGDPSTGEPVPLTDQQRNPGIRPVRRARTGTAERVEHRAVITGIGMSEVGRRLGRDPLSLVRDAALAALDDAGVAIEEVDGLGTSPGAMMGTATGVTFGGTFDLAELLDLRPTWFFGGIETAGHTGPVAEAVLAIGGGLCRHALIVRGTWEATFAARQRERASFGSGGAGPARVHGNAAWQIPFGAASPANWIAVYATHHMATYGTTREQLGAIALNARANAARNPAAVYRNPLTMDDYLSARTISTPFGLYDCDVPCDGAVAVVVSHIDTAADRPTAPIRIDAMGTAITERISWDQGTVVHEPLVRGPAEHLWTRTDLRPGDVDVAEIYDGFTFNCLSWLEALGFCGIGEGGPFVEGGRRIALDGELPLNTHGGQLSAGRLHGFGFLHEAVVQLRGLGGDRQVPGDPEVALVATGGGYPGGTLLLTRHR